MGLYRAATQGDPAAAAAFWADEYRLDALIAGFPKPVVALQHGIVLGGGIGISAHAAHRIVTERSSLGLPETTIGYAPDVGSLFLLSRSPGELGTYLALSGASVGAGDAIAVGLADRFVPSERIEALVASLTTEPAASAIDRHATAAPYAALLDERSWIDPAFAGDDVAVILDRLAAHSDPGANAVGELIRGKSPTALAVTLAAIRRAAALPTLGVALDQDFTVSMHLLAEPDFAEGIRAQVIDKDRAPRWRPSTPFTPEQTDRFFEPVDGGPNLGGIRQ